MTRLITTFFRVSLCLLPFLLFSCTENKKPSKKNKKGGIIFSHESGHYNNEFELELDTKKENAEIIYTLDGSLPQKGKENTFKYESPIKIKKDFVNSSDLSYIPTTTQPEVPNYETWLKPKSNSIKGITLRSQLIFNDGKKGKLVTKTFFVDGLIPNLPEIYLTIKKEALFDNDTGIYVPGKHQIEGKKYSGNFFQRGKQWERKAHLQYLSSNFNVDLNQDIGVRTHGMASPAAPMKTIKFYARKEYGKGKFKFSPFVNQPQIKEYKRLLLRTPYSNWDKRFFNDQLVQHVTRDLDLEIAASIPVSLYINGEYWGIHDMAEKIEQHFFKSHFNANEDSLCYANSMNSNEMGKSRFKDIFNFVKKNDLSIQNNFDSVSSMIDIDNFIDYNIIETYLNNWDWPYNNNEKWRADGISEKWRWILIDMDAAFLNHKFKTIESLMDTTNEKTKAWPFSTLIFRKLIQNEQFKSKFISRYEKLMSTTLCEERLLKIVEDYEKLLEKDIDRQINRWTLPESKKRYEIKTKDIKIFIKKRRQFVIEDIKEQFGVTINPQCK